MKMIDNVSIFRLDGDGIDKKGGHYLFVWIIMLTLQALYFKAGLLK
jgi:hypothetical protein